MRARRASRLCRAGLVAIAAGTAVFGVVGGAPPLSAASSSKTGKILAVGAENEYADVISQIGGQYVKAAAIMSNPNTDPHAFEASPKVSQAVQAARLVVQNGVGYDAFMTKIEKASPSSSRTIINAQHLLGLADTTPNPHLWYRPTTMPAVAKAVARALSDFQPAHTRYFHQNLAVFDASLAAYDQEIAKIHTAFPGAPVATTEPVADDLLQAAGTDNMTPFALQAAIMNGTTPAPQNVTLQNSLFTHKKVKVVVYNQQVTDSVTQGFLALAQRNGIPVVGVYETMPTPGYHYQSWMLAEADAVYNALANGTSAPRL